MPVAVRPAASTYAAVSDVWADCAAALPALVAPRSVPGGKPVIAVPGATPRSPCKTDEPVLVTVEPASTEYGVADPRSTERA